MVIAAVAYDAKDCAVSAHFGHSPYFAVYEYGETVDDCRKTVIDTSALSGHQQMCERMKELGADYVIAGSMGDDAKAALLAADIIPVLVPAGNADLIADLVVTGQLSGTGFSCNSCCGSCDGCEHECDTGNLA